MPPSARGAEKVSRCCEHRLSIIYLSIYLSVYLSIYHVAFFCARGPPRLPLHRKFAPQFVPLSR